MQFTGGKYEKEDEFYRLVKVRNIYNGVVLSLRILHLRG
jgi:hypothetical protein